MKKILFIGNIQFGYLTDTFKYCEYINNTYDVEYICFDSGEPKIKMPNVKVHYIPYTKSHLIRGLYYMAYTLCRLIFYKGFIFIVYFPRCSYLKRILFWKKMHIDIRTLSVNHDENARKIEDSILEKEINRFNSISFISDGVKNKLNIKSKIPIFSLPLGADSISTTPKQYNDLKLLYIGSLTNRNIITTVKGLELFLQHFPQIELTYDIIGNGTEFTEIKQYIYEHNLSKHIQLHGKIPHNMLKPYLDKNNIGVSFIPILDYYQEQPPTKTYEYAMSGLYCIATCTKENKKIINSRNGILINDTAESFAQGLHKIYLSKEDIRYTNIIESMQQYSWESIIKKHLYPIINK